MARKARRWSVDSDDQYCVRNSDSLLRKTSATSSRCLVISVSFVLSFFVGYSLPCVFYPLLSSFALQARLMGWWPIRLAYEKRGCISRWYSGSCVQARPESCEDQCRSHGDVSQNYVATYPHTAHQLGPAKIAYRFHPFFEHDVTVLRAYSRGDVPAVLVRVDVNAHDDAIASVDVTGRELKIVVPCWMLDEAACSLVVVREKPLLEFQALLRLRRLVDQLATAVGECDPGSHGSNTKGDCHATNNSQTAIHDAASQATDA